MKKAVILAVIFLAVLVVTGKQLIYLIATAYKNSRQRRRFNDIFYFKPNQKFRQPAIFSAAVCAARRFRRE